jgi:hypothetical protein
MEHHACIAELELASVRDAAGAPVQLSVHVHQDTVQLFSRSHCCAVVDRKSLRDWLNHPDQPLTFEAATWKAATDHGVVLAVPMLFVSHRLSNEDLEALRDAL